MVKKIMKQATEQHIGQWTVVISPNSFQFCTCRSFRHSSTSNADPLSSVTMCHRDLRNSDGPPVPDPDVVRVRVQVRLERMMTPHLVALSTLFAWAYTMHDSVIPKVISRQELPFIPILSGAFERPLHPGANSHSTKCYSLQLETQSAMRFRAPCSFSRYVKSTLLELARPRAKSSGHV